MKENNKDKMTKEVDVKKIFAFKMRIRNFFIGCIMRNSEPTLVHLISFIKDNFNEYSLELLSICIKQTMEIRKLFSEKEIILKLKADKEICFA